jgi:hypothetical protein
MANRKYKTNIKCNPISINNIALEIYLMNYVPEIDLRTSDTET